MPLGIRVIEAGSDAAGSWLGADMPSIVPPWQTTSPARTLLKRFELQFCPRPLPPLFPQPGGASAPPGEERRQDSQIDVEVGVHVVGKFKIDCPNPIEGGPVR